MTLPIGRPPSQDRRVAATPANTSVPTGSSPTSAHFVRSFHTFSSRVSADISGITHPGLLRENNEDHFYIARMSRALETLSTSLPVDDVPRRAEEINYALVVADGMGGHAAGEVASRLAISMLVGLVLELPNWILKIDDESAPELEQRARDVVERVGATMFDQGRKDPGLRGMGSTLTIARSLGDHLLVVHVGDSRAYLFRNGTVHQLTRDHTYAQMLVDCGALQAHEVASSGVKHMLTNALGGSTKHVDVDVDIVRLEDGDRLLLCSDGLSDLVDSTAVAGILASHPSSTEACEALIKAALDAGGRDNVTVVVAGYTFPKAEGPE